MTPNPDRAAAEAAALQTALVLAAKVGWRFDPGPIPPTPFAAFLYVAKAHLLLVPTSSGLPYAIRQVEAVVRETRSDALIVSQPIGSVPTFAFASWARHETIWTHPLALWLSEPENAWLVPADPDADELGFELIDALHRLTAPPWSSDIERFAGFGRATDWMARVTGLIREGR